MHVAMNTPRIEIVDREMARILSQKTEAERLQVAWGMWRSARKMLWQLVESENDNRTVDEVRDEVNRRMASGT